MSATSGRTGSAGGCSIGGKINCLLRSSKTRSIVAERFTSRWKRSATCCDCGAPSSPLQHTDRNDSARWSQFPGAA
jgi:hypothetical protein